MIRVVIVDELVVRLVAGIKDWGSNLNLIVFESCFIFHLSSLFVVAISAFYKYIGNLYGYDGIYKQC